MKKIDYLYYITVLLLFCAIGGLLYYHDVLGLLMWPLLISAGMCGLGITSVYKMVTCEESVRIPLDVVMLDNQIDMWRGRLCSAQHEDDLESESLALIHIDVYQDMRVAHGLKPVPRVS